MAADFINKNQDVIQSAQNKLNNLMGQYVKVNNSNDLSDAVGQNSLKEQPLNKRFIYGVGFNAVSTTPVLIDFSPLIGYKFNKNLEFGFAGQFRLSFDTNNGHHNYYVSNTSGIKAFGNYKIKNNWLASIEYEMLLAEIQDYQNQDIKSNIWNSSLWAGFGKRISTFPWINTQFRVMYNFIDEDYGIYQSRFKIDIIFITDQK